MPPQLVVTRRDGLSFVNLTPSQVVHSCLRVDNDDANRAYYLPTAKAVARYLGPDRDPHELPDRENSDENYPLLRDRTEEVVYETPGVTFWMYACNIGTEEFYFYNRPSVSRGWTGVNKTIRPGESVSYLCHFRDEYTTSSGTIVEPKVTSFLWQG